MVTRDFRDRRCPQWALCANGKLHTKTESTGVTSKQRSIDFAQKRQNGLLGLPLEVLHAAVAIRQQQSTEGASHNSGLKVLRIVETSQAAGEREPRLRSAIVHHCTS